MSKKILEKLKNWGSRINKGLKKGDFIITIIIVIGILGMVNFFAYQAFTRFDFTQNNIYSISQTSKEAVSELDDVVRIKIYFSKDLPNKYTNLEEQIKGILSEYVNYGDGQVKVESVNPGELENAKRKLAGMGIPEMRFNVMKEGSYQVTTGYMGIAVEYGDNSESIPVVKGTENLEYKVTTAIKKVTQENVPQVGLVTGYGGLAESGDKFKTARKKLEEVYEVKEVDLSQKEIPSEVDTLIVSGPTKKFKEDALKKLDSFIMGGGSTIFLVDGVKIDNGVMATQNKTDINNLLENYGLRINNNVVLDTANARVSFRSGLISYQKKYPPWVKVKKENFNKDNVAVADLESLTLPWVSSIEKTSASSGSYITLAQTTPNSWTQEQKYNLRPNKQFMPNSTAQRDLAVMTSGELSSAYSDASTQKGKIIAVGDSDFVKERFLSRNRDNLVFFQNLVDSVTLDSDLIKIRSKEVTDRPLKDISNTAQTTLKYLNIFGLAVVVVIVGVVRYYIRKKRS